MKKKIKKIIETIKEQFVVPDQITHFDDLHDRLINLAYGGGHPELTVRILLRNTEKLQIVAEIKDSRSGEVLYSNLGAQE